MTRSVLKDVRLWRGGYIASNEGLHLTSLTPGRSSEYPVSRQATYRISVTPGGEGATSSVIRYLVPRNAHHGLPDGRTPGM